MRLPRFLRSRFNVCMLAGLAAGAAAVRYYDTGTRRAQLAAGKGPHLRLIGGRAFRPALDSHLAVIFAATVVAAFAIAYVTLTIAARARRRRVMQPARARAMRGFGGYGGGEW